MLLVICAPTGAISPAEKITLEFRLELSLRLDRPLYYLFVHKDERRARSPNGAQINNLNLACHPKRVAQEGIVNRESGFKYMLNKSQKSAIIEDLKEKATAQKVVIFSDFHGLSVAKQQELRRLLKKENAEYKVAKKTLLERAFAAAKAPFSHINYKGELGVVFGFGDEIAPAKSLAKFARANPDSMKIIGGTLGGRELSREEVLALAKLPGKHELLGQLVGVLVSPIRGLMNVMNGNQRKLVVALGHIVAKK